MKNSRKFLEYAVIVFLFLFAFLFASLSFVNSGNSGIEERFSQAVGLPFKAEEGEQTFSGFAIEGKMHYYIIILVLLFTMSLILYKKFKI